MAQQTKSSYPSKLHVKTESIAQGPENPREVGPEEFFDERAIFAFSPCIAVEFGGDSDGVELDDVVEALLFPPPNKWRTVVTIPKDMVIDVIRAIRNYVAYHSMYRT